LCWAARSNSKLIDVKKELLSTPKKLSDKEFHHASLTEMLQSQIAEKSNIGNLEHMNISAKLKLTDMCSTGNERFEFDVLRTNQAFTLKTEGDDLEFKFESTLFPILKISKEIYGEYEQARKQYMEVAEEAVSSTSKSYAAKQLSLVDSIIKHEDTMNEVFTEWSDKSPGFLERVEIKGKIEELNALIKEFKDQKKEPKTEIDMDKIKLIDTKIHRFDELLKELSVKFNKTEANAILETYVAKFTEDEDIKAADIDFIKLMMGQLIPTRCEHMIRSAILSNQTTLGVGPDVLGADMNDFDNYTLIIGSYDKKISIEDLCIRWHFDAQGKIDLSVELKEDLDPIMVNLMSFEGVATRLPVQIKGIELKLNISESKVFDDPKGNKRLAPVIDLDTSTFSIDFLSDTTES